jgi:raffinose/stachyose/melibiose transport system substrate-binding protein
MAVFSGTAAMDLQGQWYDGTIIQEKQDMNLYGTFAFPSGGTNRMSAFAEMVQLNKNLSEEKLAAAIKFLDYWYSKENAAKYAEYYNLPLPRLDADMPAGQPNVAIMMQTSGKNGTFTITDQAFPTEVADELFRVQDGIANGQITPRDGAARIQAAIDAYRKK